MDLQLSHEFYPFGYSGRDGIDALEHAMHALPDELKGDCEEHTEHHFAPGLYVRQFNFKAGEVVVGKIHRHDHFAMLVSGTLTIADQDGTRTITGPLLFKSKAGIKRAGYAHTDAIFLNFHPTDETDLDLIERDVIAPSYDALNAPDVALIEQEH